MTEKIYIRADETASCTDFILEQIGNGAMAAPPPDEMEMFIEEWERDHNETLNSYERQCVQTNISWVYRDVDPRKPRSRDRVMVEGIGEDKNDPARKFKRGLTKN